MLRNLDQLSEASKDPRLAKLPMYAQILIRDLAVRMRMEASHARNVEEKADRETEAARRLLNEGPADADTFLSLDGVLPNSLSEDGREDERPLGKGCGIEFRAPGSLPGEGFVVWMTNGRLNISGMNPLAVLPVSTDRVTITKI